MSRIDGLAAAGYTIPAPEPEADGTLSWRATTVVTVTVSAAGRQGLGWTYGPAAAASVVEEVLAPAVLGADPCDVPGCHLAMQVAARNAMLPGLVTLALSAVDVALWDLKARLLDVPLAALFGRVRHRVPLYGSGGFTTLTDAQLREQLTAWVAGDGMAAVKIKIAERHGAAEERDLHRIALARQVIGPAPELMVDANGGYHAKQAVRVARAAAADRVTWFEEPVSSDDLAGLALLRSTVEPEVTAGEYGTGPGYFRRMCAAGAVDCLQIDATRCGGYTGFLASAALADAFGLQVSAHCAPQLHAPVCAAVPNLRHVEWFADHVRADRILFDGVLTPAGGTLCLPDNVAGHGLSVRTADASRYRV